MSGSERPGRRLAGEIEAIDTRIEDAIEPALTQARGVPSVWLAVVLPVIAVGLILGAWLLVQAVFHPAEYLLPAPGTVLNRMVEDRASLLSNLADTVKVAILGLFLSLVLGVLIGLAMARSTAVMALLMPAIVATQSIPKIALAPLLVVWLGLGIAPKLVVVVLITFFPIILGTVVGIQSVSGSTMLLARSTGMTSVNLYRYVLLPSAAPYIAASFRLGASLALIGALFAEFVGSTSGIGTKMVLAIGTHDTVLAFAALIVTALGGMVLYAAAAGLTKLVTRRFVPRSA
jgi:NitT/TauT family transport system permease protein